MFKKIVCIFTVIAVLAAATAVSAADAAGILSNKAYINGVAQARLAAGRSYDIAVEIRNNSDRTKSYAVIAAAYASGVCTAVSIGEAAELKAEETKTITAAIDTVTGVDEVKCIAVEADGGRLYPANSAVKSFRRTGWS